MGVAPVHNAKKWNIFIVHPSKILTDTRADGDGLLAYRTICELASRGHHVSVACQAIELKQPAPRNVTLYPIALRLQRFGLMRRVEYAWRMRRLFLKLNATQHFDVAHQLNPVYAGLSLGLAGIDVPLVLGPYVAHWPSLRRSPLKRFLADTVDGIQQRFAGAIVLCGPSARARIVSKRVAPTDVFTVPYGIDREMFPEREMPVGDPSILYLAGFAERKGLGVLLAAFDLVAARVPNARLTIAGDGKERERYRQIASRSRFCDRISFLGFVSRTDVSQTLGACTVYCLPSFGEPYGMSLVEAMCTGRAVVATDAGGPADLVDPRGGALVPPGDAPAMARALERILRDPQLSHAMGSYNRRATSAFEWATVIDRLEAVYDRVIDRSRAGIAGVDSDPDPTTVGT